MNLFSGMIYKIFSHVFFQVASSFLWGTNLMNYIKLRTRVSPNHSFIHSTMFTVHFLWARAKIEWWVISDTGPSLMEFAVCCNSQDISQKPCCIIVSNTITIIKFIVTSHWEAVCPPRHHELHNQLLLSFVSELTAASNPPMSRTALFCSW